MKILTTLGAAVGGLVIAVVILAVVFVWDAGIGPSFGMAIGYYGHFNRVKAVIESMPNVKIVNHWQHKDITLEDFGFTVLVDGNREAKVNFWENSPQMKQRDKPRLRKFIQKEIDSNQALERTSQ